MGWYYRCVWIVLAAAAAADEPALSATGTCDQAPGFYANAHYRVAQVEVQSPFDYLRGVRDLMQEALASTGVKKGSEYSSAEVIRGQQAITAQLHAIANRFSLPIDVTVVIGKPIHCYADTSPPSLTVSYLVFTSWFPFTLSHTFETHTADEQDPAKAARVDQKKFHFAPRAGYNHTARLFGGLRTSVEMPVVGVLALDGMASTSSAMVETTQSGQFRWEDGWVRSAEWRTGYRYADVPTDPGHLTESRLTTQFAANSAPLGGVGAVIRFGGAVGGGYDQSRISANDLPPGTTTSNPAGEGKAYIGVSLGTGHQSFKASYAVKLGQSQTGARIDFVKQLADVAYETRFFPSDHHRPIELESHLSGGWITNRGAIPAVERFFGGNHDYNFLMGDSWQIRSEPFIRSFPQNTLNRLTPNAPVGGQQFVSANFTLAVTVWHRPLVPPDITGNPDFPDILKGELATAQRSIKAYWISKDRSIPGALELSPDAVAAVREVGKQLNGIKDSVPDDLSDSYGECVDVHLFVANGYADNLEEQSTKPFDRYTAISNLAAAKADGSFEKLDACVQKFRSQIGEDSVAELLKRADKVQASIREALAKVDTNVAEMKASRDMAFVSSTVHTLVDEMNFASISPVLVADIARIGPQPSDAAAGFRYGVGGGVRFTLLDTIRLTAGYAFNPNPKPWEGRGATFFALEIVSLFR